MASAAAGTDYCALPAAVSPDGIYNFTDPPSLKSTVFGVSCTLTGIALLLALARVWVKRRNLRQAEYVTILATLLELGFFSTVMAQGRYYRHQWDVPACWIDARYMKIVFCNTLLFGLCLGVSKVTIMLLYLELFAVQRRMRIATYVGIAFTIGLYITFIPCSAYFEAPHIGQTWSDLVTNGQPNHAVPWSIAIGVGSVLIDIYIFILPIPVLLRLHMSTSKRIQLVALFGTALFGVAASIVGLAYRVPLLAPRNLLAPGIDNTWHVAQVNIANLVECNVAISVACLPACVNLFRRNFADHPLWKSLKSAFMSRGSKYVNHESDESGLSRKVRPMMQSSRSTLGQVPARLRGEENGSFELIETNQVKSQFDQYSQAAVSVGRAPDAEYYQGGPGITRTVDIFQQEHEALASVDREV